ncbi:MAG TPA: acylphosphatase [Holophaga sp.]|nr:acylphosphatase [Holophaga sp.]
MRMAFCVHGRVQGVGFRYHVLEEAWNLGLAGWVHNEYDGTVGGEVEGEPLLLEEFRRALERGPSMAYVTRLDWSPLVEGQSLPLPFEVRR